MLAKLFRSLVPILCLALTAAWCGADVDWQTTKQLDLPDAPLDMKFSRDGQWLYLLTGKGELLVYDLKGEFKGKVEVGTGVEAIEPGPFEGEVYLLNRNSNRIKVIEVSPARQIDINEAPFKGAADAPVVIVDFTDFQCPYCAKLVETFDQLLKIYPNQLKIVYKSYPLGTHKFAYRAATAAMAAHQKGRFWEFHDALFKHHKSLDESKIDEVRKAFGFDTREFTKLMNDPKIRSQVARDRNEGQRLGVRGTPTVFVNGKRLKDKRLDGFRAAIDKALREAKK